MLPAAADLGEAFFRLRERIGLPARLSDLGVDAATIARAAPFSASDHANRTNPRKATAEDYLGMMHAAL
jgi:alcohol dehydrogenase class IV